MPVSSPLFHSCASTLLQDARKALTPELYNEYMLCRKFPKQLDLHQKHERLQRAVLVAFKAKQVSEVASLKQQIAGLAYKPLAQTPAEITERLHKLLLNLDNRYDELAEQEDEEQCCLVVEYCEKINHLLTCEGPQINDSPENYTEVEERSLDGKSLDGRSFDGRSYDGTSIRSFDIRSVDVRSSDGRSVASRSSDGSV